MPVTELWDDVGPLDGGWTDAGAGSDEFGACVAYALVDDSEAVFVGEVTCFFETIDGLSHRLVWRVEVLCDTADESPLSITRMTCAAVSPITSYIYQLPKSRKQ